MISMRPVSPLPAHLETIPFTVAEARAASLSRGRLRSSDLASAGRLLYLPAGWDFELPAMARAVSAATPGAWISHVTAARLLGLWLPPWLQDSRVLHLSKTRALPPVRRDGVVGHTVLVHEGETMDWEGIHISTPARTWLDLCRVLPLEHAVAIGDQLVRQPRDGLELRTTPWATVQELRGLLKRHPKMQGIVKARAAVELIRIGADSAPETFLRLALVDAGLPEPELQVRLLPVIPTRRLPTSGTGRGGLPYSTTAAITLLANSSPATTAGTPASTPPAGITSNSMLMILRTTSGGPPAWSAQRCESLKHQLLYQFWFLTGRFRDQN